MPHWPILEFTEYITPDGEVYQLHVPSHVGRWILSQSGWGTPPIDYITERGPFQDGVTVKDFFLTPRTIQLLIRQRYCSRDDWWTGRGNLLDAIRPNRQTIATAALPGQLIRRLSTGDRRALDVFITDGPRFEPRQTGRWDEWSFQEALRFTAFDPVIYDPTEVTVTVETTVAEELVFPITFDVPGVVGARVAFGREDINITQNVNYVGTWLSYPIIEITGPLDNPRVDNLTTGEFVELDFNVPAGRVVTIDMRYGFKTVTDDLGVNLIGTLTTDSDLATFHIAPNPEAPGGVNEIRFSGNNANANSQMVLRFFTRYFGI